MEGILYNVRNQSDNNNVLLFLLFFFSTTNESVSTGLSKADAEDRNKCRVDDCDI